MARLPGDPRTNNRPPPRPTVSAQRNPPKPFVGTAGIVDVPRTVHSALLSEVRSAAHNGYDRFVWQFGGKTLPGYHVEYIDKPIRKCGSGELTEVAGDGWLEVRLYPANAHTEAGKPTVAERERALQLGVARELELTCDFEAVVTWVIGVTSPNRYRVLELEEPARLVVDILHSR